MTIPLTDLDIPEERQQARQMAHSTFIPVGKHISGSFDNLTPVSLSSPEDAQFLKLQALTSNLRYKVDGTAPTVNTGFQLFAGSDVLIPCAVNQIIFIGENNGNYEAQWVR